RFPSIYSILGTPSTIKYAKETQKLLSSSCAIISFSCPSFEAQQVVDLARQATRTWIQLNQIGYRVQPLSLSSLLACEISFYGPPTNFPKKQSLAFQSLSPKIREHLNIPENHKLFWIFRVGKGPALPSQMRTQRNPVEMLLTKS